MHVSHSQPGRVTKSSRSHTFKCSLDHVKRSFYRAVNGIFGRIGRTASEEVILELIKSKCLPILLYSLEALSLIHI